MGRESHAHDPTVVHSSIALLQERFRQLQRVKEMREERELLKILSESKQFNCKPTTTTYEPTRSFFNPELIVPSSSPPHPHVSLSLWPTSQKDHRSFEAPVSVTLDPTQYLQQASWKNVYDCASGNDSDSGVDTSLHL